VTDAVDDFLEIILGRSFSSGVRWSSSGTREPLACGLGLVTVDADLLDVSDSPPPPLVFELSDRCSDAVREK
jgi:hypothetical protein